METIVILLFAAGLAGCVALNLPLLLALATGYVLFFTYGLLKRHTAREMLEMSLSGVKTVKNILFLFLLIGMMTALWRTAGTIPAIVSYASGAVRPSVMVLMTFLLNALVSVLTGTSLGTAATMGVICVTVAGTMGVDPVLTGGAMLSGVYFGDRCSPVSTSALLVAELTGTDIFRNIREMMKSSLVPLLLTCAVYGTAGILSAPTGDGGAPVRDLFAGSFRLGLLPLVPAALVLVLVAFRVRVRATISLSVAAALIISLVYQHVPFPELLRSMVLGYRSARPELAAMLDGGGIVSMVKAGATVCLSSSYAGMFQGTGLLDGLKEKLQALAERTTPFTAVLVSSVACCAVACNQTLATILAPQLCGDIVPDRQELAIDMENSGIVIAALIPWNIACTVPLTTVGAPTASILAACYLYLLPLWTLLSQWRRAKTPSRRTSRPF